MKLAPALLGLAILATAPVARGDRPTDASDRVAPLAAAIRTHDVGAIAKRLSDRVTIEAMDFRDAACAKQFPAGTEVVAPKLTALAKCLGQLTLHTTTRVSGGADVAVLTIDPGIELELAFKGTRVWRIGFAVATRLPTFSARVLESHRLGGSLDVDAAVAASLQPSYARTHVPASVWIKVCLAASGAVARQTPLSRSSDEAADAFLVAIRDWKFRPFELDGVAIEACSLALLTYPAAKAPAIETLPLPRVVKDLVQPVKIVRDGPPPPPPPPPDNDGEVAGCDPCDVPLPAPPIVKRTNVAPLQLEASRIKGNQLIAPDDSTKVEIAQAGKERVIGTFKLCVDTRGTVALVNLLKTTGFPAYDKKLEREIRLWGYKPYLINGAAAAVCTAVTFIYSQDLPAPPPPRP